MLPIPMHANRTPRESRTDASPALVLVDFDDTLVETAPRFQRARRGLFARLARAGFDETLAERVHHEEVEPRAIGRRGVGPFRLEYSFRETYLRLCERTGAVPESGIADECARLGRRVAGTPPSIDGALDALRTLSSAFPTVLYTQAGDRAYQLGCVREAGVLDVLSPDRVRVCERKTADAFRATLAHYRVEDPARGWMIGDSIRSDVNPALAVGARAILVEIDDPRRFDQVEPVSDDFVRVPSFAAAVAHLLGREGAPPPGTASSRASQTR